MDIGPDDPVFPIGVVRELTGLSARQIRYYDQQGLVVPVRTRGNQRLYSIRETAELRRVKEMIVPGMKISQVKERLSRGRALKEREGERLTGLENCGRGSAYQSHSPLEQGGRLYTRGYLDELLTRLLKDEG